MNKVKKITKNIIMKKKICIILILLLLCFVSACTAEADETMSEIIKVNDISINKSHLYVDVNNTEILLAQVFPLNANNQNIIWKSDNPNVAKVNDGIVSGVSEGRTNITATSEDGNFSTNCIVYVSTKKLDYENTYNGNKTNVNFNNLEKAKIEQLSENEINNNQSAQNDANDEIFNGGENYRYYYSFDNLNGENMGFSFEYNSNGLNEQKNSELIHSEFRKPYGFFEDFFGIEFEKINNEENITSEEVLYEDEFTVLKKFTFN